MKTNFLFIAAIAGLTTLSACSKADTANAHPVDEAQTQDMKITM